VKVVLALLVAGFVAVPAAEAYRNPTPGQALVVQIPGMHRAKVKRNIVYKRSPRLQMDVYRPRTARGRLPAVLLGGSSGSAKHSGQKVGWAQLIAASGLTAVAFDTRSDHVQQMPRDPSRDVAAAIAYVRAHAARLGIDATRLCTLSFSAESAPWHLWATMRDPQPWLRCNVVYYGPLDFQSPAFSIDSGLVEEFSALTYLRRHPSRIPPMLVIKAGRDRDEGVNESIDRFETAARSLHADVRVVTHATGSRGFDISRPTARARAIVRETLRFLKARLAKPLRLSDSCLSDRERGAAVRFFASDDTPLAGVLLGSGPRGVVLAHGSRLDLCQWLPEARRLASLGYRVLAYDSRSGVRVDLDMEAAVEALRRSGAERVAAVGSSLGALAALVGGARLWSPPDAVISLSSPSSYGPVNALTAVPKLHVPILFAASQDDAPFADDARALYAASSSAQRRLEVVPGAAHGVDMLQDPAFESLFTGYLAAHLR
jgi:BD-FAE